MPWIIQERGMKASCSLNCHNFLSNKYCGLEGIWLNSGVILVEVFIVWWSKGCKDVQSSNISGCTLFTNIPKNSLRAKREYSVRTQEVVLLFSGQQRNLACFKNS